MVIRSVNCFNAISITGHVGKGFYQTTPYIGMKDFCYRYCHKKAKNHVDQRNLFIIPYQHKLHFISQLEDDLLDHIDLSIETTHFTLILSHTAVTVSMLRDEDVHYDCSNIILKYSIIEKDLIISLREVLLRNYITKINDLVIFDIC